jgi:hypothetical protein
MRLTGVECEQAVLVGRSASRPFAAALWSCVAIKLKSKNPGQRYVKAKKPVEVERSPRSFEISSTRRYAERREQTLPQVRPRAKGEFQ